MYTFTFLYSVNGKKENCETIRMISYLNQVNNQVYLNSKDMQFKNEKLEFG